MSKLTMPQATIRGTIEYRDGWMCLKLVDTMWSEPKRVAQWLPIEHEAPGERATLDLTGCEGYLRDGWVGFRMGLSPTAAWAKERRLPDGTRFLATLTEDYPCPKVRKGVETRYRNGRWEKYTKTLGWIEA